MVKFWFLVIKTSWSEAWRICNFWGNWGAGLIALIGGAVAFCIYFKLRGIKRTKEKIYAGLATFVGMVAVFFIVFVYKFLNVPLRTLRFYHVSAKSIGMPLNTSVELNFDKINIGCIAPRTLVNTGAFYVFLAKDGIRTYDGGRRTLLDTTQGSTVISLKIKPLIDDLVKSGNYKSAVGIYYPKRQWYIFSYENPVKFPKGKNNSILVYNFLTDEWFPDPAVLNAYNRIHNYKHKCFPNGRKESGKKRMYNEEKTFYKPS